MTPIINKRHHFVADAPIDFENTGKPLSVGCTIKPSTYLFSRWSDYDVKSKAIATYMFVSTIFGFKSRSDGEYKRLNHDHFLVLSSDGFRNLGMHRAMPLQQAIVKFLIVFLMDILD